MHFSLSHAYGLPPTPVKPPFFPSAPPTQLHALLLPVYYAICTEHTVFYTALSGFPSQLSRRRLQPVCLVWLCIRFPQSQWSNEISSGNKDSLGGPWRPQQCIRKWRGRPCKAAFTAALGKCYWDARELPTQGHSDSFLQEVSQLEKKTSMLVRAEIAVDPVDSSGQWSVIRHQNKHLENTGKRGENKKCRHREQL